VPQLGPGCLTRNSYVRYALIEGLNQEAQIGVNPFKFGISASTDTHNGGADLPAAAAEAPGFPQFCRVWQDLEFDPARRAVYYLRAVENPSCRYSAWQ
jgi:hypothetical protein